MSEVTGAMGLEFSKFDADSSLSSEEREIFKWEYKGGVLNTMKKALRGSADNLNACITDLEAEIQKLDGLFPSVWRTSEPLDKTTRSNRVQERMDGLEEHWRKMEDIIAESSGQSKAFESAQKSLFTNVDGTLRVL